MLKSFIFITLLFNLLLADQYQDWLKAQNQQYTTYKKSIDDEFSQMLKKDWEAFKAQNTPPSFKKPKPDEIPEVKKVVEIKKNDIKTSPKIEIKPIKVEEKKVVVKQPIKQYGENFVSTTFDFYSQLIEIKYDKNIKFGLTAINKDVISNYWEQLSKSEYKALLEQINLQVNSLVLNDWAKYQLIYKLGYSIYNDENTANLFTWFILTKMGYDTKIGYNQEHIYLLSKVAHQLYQVAFFDIDGQKYYIIEFGGRTSKINGLYTYKSSYPNANKQLSFAIFKRLNFKEDIKSKKLIFQYAGKKYIVNSSYNQNLIDFYKTFPQSDYRLYFDAQNSYDLDETLLKNLGKLVNGKTQIEAANFLLHFVQKSFAYKTDPEQFNYEKVMFPEETVYYPYSDCEDRSIMYSYLVRNLLHLDVVGIKYDDHLTTAIAFSSKIDGVGFMFNGKKYTVADPTYINANVGMSMPDYKNKRFKIIQF